jgi:hypothetical protein
MYQFKWPLCKKTKVLVLVWCCKCRGDGEQDLQKYWLPEGCIKQWCDKPSGYGCLSKKCEQGEQWSSDLAVSCTLAKLADIHSKNTRFEALCSTPLTSISIDTAVRALLSLLFLRCLSSPTVNIRSCLQEWSCHELDCVEYDPHTGFHYFKLLTYLCHDCSSFIKISGINFDGSEYRQVSNFYPD